MNRRLFGAAVVILVVAIPLVVRAGQGTQSSTVDTQSFAWMTGEASTTSQEWKRIPELRALVASCARGGATATLSMQLSPDSAPVEVRVVMEDISVVCEGKDCPPPPRMRPGRVTFEPSANSFTFARGKVPGTHGSAFKAQWRSPTGARATVEKATLALLWNAPRKCL